MSSDGRPWHPIAIADCGEPLLALPPTLMRLEPHPYAAAGAPYGPGQTPFQLRVGVVQRLLSVQQALQRLAPQWQVAIFDGWRPVAVQQFMVNLTIAEQCRQLGVDSSQPSVALAQIRADVGRFWAPPSLDLATPPPHSTGAAVDLTLAHSDGTPLDMGGAIDSIGAVSEPDHYAPAAAAEPAGSAAQWHHRRCLLRHVMEQAGFAQHPNEWWHFSHGDQLWAWVQHRPQAIYGRIEP